MQWFLLRWHCNNFPVSYWPVCVTIYRLSSIWLSLLLAVTRPATWNMRSIFWGCCIVASSARITSACSFGTFVLGFLWRWRLGRCPCTGDFSPICRSCKRIAAQIWTAARRRPDRVICSITIMRILGRGRWWPLYRSCRIPWKWWVIYDAKRILETHGSHLSVSWSFPVGRGCNLDYLKERQVRLHFWCVRWLGRNGWLRFVLMWCDWGWSYTWGSVLFRRRGGRWWDCPERWELDISKSR